MAKDRNREDRHRNRYLVTFRPEAHGDWLRAHATETGRTVNAVMVQALAEYRERVVQLEDEQSATAANATGATPADALAATANCT